VPGILVRLPRTAWDLVINGRVNLKSPEDALSAERQVPDFHATLADQFAIIQSRIDDAVRSVDSGPRWVSDPSHPYAESKIDPSDAGKIADEELKELNDWLQKRWNATPRDTVLLLKLLRHLPGGEKADAMDRGRAVFARDHRGGASCHLRTCGPDDPRRIFAGDLAHGKTEQRSAARTRQTNRAIAMRFERLARRQIRQSIAWIESRARD